SINSISIEASFNSSLILYVLTGPSWPSFKPSAWGRRASGSKSDLTEDQSYIGPVQPQIIHKGPIVLALLRCGSLKRSAVLVI
ncbi:hypothetical protein AVEN_202708-1, partial [Araneus ventricosus]